MSITDKYKFSYPDIPHVIDRDMYDYFFSLDQVLKMQGAAIKDLLKKVYGNE